MTPLARALNALERLNARASYASGGVITGSPQKQVDEGLDYIDRKYGDAKIGEKAPSRPLDATEGDAGTHGGYDATERAWWGLGVPEPYPPIHLSTKESSGLHVKRRQDEVRVNAYSELIYGDERGDTARVRKVMALADAEIVGVRDRRTELLDEVIGRLEVERDASEADNVLMAAALTKARAEVTQLAVELAAKEDETERLTADLASRTGDLDDAEARCERLQQAPHGKAKCVCNTGPDTDGPEQDCPEHGDVRWYSEWLLDANATILDKQGEINLLRILLEAARENHCGCGDVAEIPWDVQTAFERRSL